MNVFIKGVLILAVMGLVLPSFGGPSPVLNDLTKKDYDAMILQRNKQLQQFDMRVGAAKTGCEPSAEMDLAIQGLGEFRAAEYEGQLSRHLMYLPEKLVANDRYVTQMYYPAAVALVRIGGRRVIASMQWKIASTASADERDLAAWVIMSIEGKEQAIHLLDDLIAKNDTHKAAYSSARAYVINYKLSFDLPTRKSVPSGSSEFGTSLPMRDNGILLQEIAPAEYDSYKKSFAVGYGPKSLNAALALIAKTEVLRATKGLEGISDARGAFLARMAPSYAWTYLLEVYNKTSDTAVKAAILAAWDKRLEGNDPDPLLSALWNEWNKAFITDRFKKLFASEKNVNRIGKFCWALGQHGEDAEEALLREKRATLKSMDFDYSGYICCLDNIDLALKKINYGKLGDKWRVGPATIPYPEYWPF